VVVVVGGWGRGRKRIDDKIRTRGLIHSSSSSSSSSSRGW